MKIINKKNSLSAIISFIFLVIPISANCKAFADSSNLAINIITVNDFHGRIVGDYSGSKPTNDATWLYADEVSKLKSQNPDGTIFASAGDNISASLFASSIQQDNPTIDALNALNLDVSAVGNHEFDKGLDDLQNRVMKRANFPYLADNVYIKGTKTPYFPTDNLYKVITKQNIRIGFVGSVTQETPAAINPDHIKGVDFGDPVEAVNTQVAYLKNNNLADIIVALYHEGADCSDNPTDGSDYCPSIDDAKKRFPVFGEIVDKTSPDVATIVTAHTHKKYVWTDSKHNNRIVSQTGCYGQEVGNLTLNIDQTTKQLVSSSGEILAKHSFSTPIDSTEYNTYRTNSLASYPSVSQVAQISDDAQSYADAIGLTPIAGLTGNITRSLSGCQYIKDVYSCDMKQPSENRGDESSVGRMVANSYKDYVSAQLKRHIDIGVTQPGSLRTDAIPNSDGKLTYGNAVSISPFANELFISELTGAQLKQILEEQWQVDSQGQRPSRPFLGLSFSAGFTYTVDTWDPNARPGNHILSMWINGKLVKDDKTYTVIETSFLQTGGDNFRGFTAGKHSDSGFIDSDALINYAKDKGLNYNFRSDYARSSAVLKNHLLENIKAGSAFSQTIANLNIYSDGAPQNKTGEVYLLKNNSEKKIGTFKVNNGQSDISAKIPDNISSGNYTVKYVVYPSNTTIYQNISIISNNYPNPFYPDTGLPFKEILSVFIILLIIASVCKKASKF